MTRIVLRLSGLSTPRALSTFRTFRLLGRLDDLVHPGQALGLPNGHLPDSLRAGDVERVVDQRLDAREEAYGVR
jgi:hypothetical protein